jgi:hypothetical protein
MAIIQFKRGTTTQLATAASAGELRAGEPYLETDGKTLAVGTSATELLRLTNKGEFDTYRQVCANGTGFPVGAGTLDFATNGTVSLSSPDGEAIEAYYNGVLMPLPASVSYTFTARYSGYLVALPGEDTLTAVESPTSLNHRIVAWVGYNPNSPEPFWYAGFEMHTPYRNPDAHLLHHLETGMTWLSGGELTREDENDPENVRFALTNVYVADEDLQFTIENDGAQDGYTTNLLRFNDTFYDEIAGAVWTKNGAVDFTDSNHGDFGRCANFTNGIHAWLKRTAPTLGRADFTVELWANIQAVGAGYQGRDTVALAGYMYGSVKTDFDFVIRHLHYSGQDFLALTVSGYSTSTPLLTGTHSLIGAGWTHIALTREADVWRLWVNGTLEAEATFAYDFNYPYQKWLIGGIEQDSGMYAWTGQLDEARISIGLARYIKPFTPPNAPFAHSDLPQGNFLQELSPRLKAPILYIDVNGNWASSGLQTGLLSVYNALDANNKGSFALIEDGRFANYWLCFTTCQNTPVKWLMGRQQFESVADARLEQFKRIGLPTPEVVAAYQVVVEGDSTTVNGLTIARIQRVGRASRIDDYALTGYENASSTQDQWPLYALRRMMWTEQRHSDITGTWMRLGGDITGYEDAYPTALFPSLVNLASGDVVITPTMTADNLPAPALVTHSSTVSPSGNPGWKLFDGSTDTSWRSVSGAFTIAGGDEWVQIDLGEARAAGYIKLTVVDSAHSPKSWALYGANDNSGVAGSWYDSATLLLAVSAQNELDVIDATTFGKAIANHSAFRYFRLRVLTLQSASSTSAYLAEMQLLAPAMSLKSTEDAVGSCLYMKVAA